jgi:hypothetical protein
MANKQNFTPDEWTNILESIMRPALDSLKVMAENTALA